MFCSCKRLDKQISLTGANRLDHVEILQFVTAEYFMTIWLIEVNLINQKVQTNHKRSERDWSCWCFQIVLVPNDGSLLMWPFLCLRARSEDILILEKWLSQSVAETLHSISLRRPFYLVFWKRIVVNLIYFRAGNLIFLEVVWRNARTSIAHNNPPTWAGYTVPRKL